MDGMENPVLFMAQVFSYRMDDKNDLIRTLNILHGAFETLYERKIFRTARSAVGFVEVAPTDGMRSWNVHTHLIIDLLADGIDVDAANLAWQKLIGSRAGGFSIDAAVRSRERIAAYITKRESYSPKPGKLPVRVLEALFIGLHGRRLLVSRRLQSRVGRVRVQKVLTAQPLSDHP